MNTTCYIMILEDSVDLIVGVIDINSINADCLTPILERHFDSSVKIISIDEIEVKGGFMVKGYVDEQSNEFNLFLHKRLFFKEDGISNNEKL